MLKNWEMKYLLNRFFFLKPTSSIITQGEQIEIPYGSSELHHEVELGLIIGKHGKNIRRESALDYIAGYTLALDMTDRERQNVAKKKGLPWSFAKGCDTFCPIGDFIEKDQIKDLNNVELWLKVDDKEKQRGNTNLMIFKVPELLEYISSHMTLEEGDLVLTGTPAGVGPVKPGQEIHCGITGVTEMKFSVRSKPSKI
eukprot:TRINITY_DN746_c0_g1_i1.p1 TRINITY_DN746_c0_g1~~TRINITY_DN746_c0_g1_i1.p1  ORF type:complete len:198 (-),score=49.91 TRINITY_DN746_c0_g1_i1:18-611(-)